MQSAYVLSNPDKYRFCVIGLEDYRLKVKFVSKDCKFKNL